MAKDSGLFDNREPATPTSPIRRQAQSSANTRRSDEVIREIIALIKSDPEAGMRWLQREFEKSLLAYADRFLRNTEDAKDVVSDTYLEVLMNIDDIQPAAFRAWLFKVTSHACIDILRSHKRKVEIYKPDNGVSIYDEADTITVLNNALKNLTDDQRDAFILCVWEGMTASEAASELGMNLGAVQTNLYRAKNLLRASLYDALFGHTQERIAKPEERMHLNPDDPMPGLARAILDNVVTRCLPRGRCSGYGQRRGRIWYFWRSGLRYRASA